jgi:hypothetical protein
LSFVAILFLDLMLGIVLDRVHLLLGSAPAVIQGGI